ncbi:hypothetical protein [Janthinobacterium sp. RB2R34]|uniref:hypothetical protein n=1 Tax=Janthinobacterium sp. RB2R34 TaxID=3424193 RepID=UPI003F27BA96
MESIEARILLKNFLKRVQPTGDGRLQILGTITEDELEALRFALAALDPSTPAVDIYVQSGTPQLIPEVISSVVVPNSVELDDEFVLDTTVLLLPAAKADVRLCFDFGTAMSKVTLVHDESSEREFEEIDVLKLGVPGDQEEIDEFMLVSSVYIDNAGLLWFGQMAVAKSQIEGGDGGRQRLDNIKRYLSEEGLTSRVGQQFNPTGIDITYADMILAYLMYLTWAVTICVEELGFPRNLGRRFAMPCFTGSKAREIVEQMHDMLEQSQLLADTFTAEINSGLNLELFMQGVKAVRAEKHKTSLVAESITEPLGVAGSLISWKMPVNTLAMVIDVGAGTSDFSLFRLAFNPESNKSIALEVAGSSRCITEAGNYLDKLLKGLILREAGVNSTHSHWLNIHGALELNLRDLKESLFRDQSLSVSLFDGRVVEIHLDAFLKLKQVEDFGKSLAGTMREILEKVNFSFIEGAPNNTLALVFTGGGADLPMVRSLSEGEIEIKNITLNKVAAKGFPSWLSEQYPELEDMYPRIAVSLGGARKKIIEHGGLAAVTAGDVKSTPKLDGYFVTGD